MVCTKVRWSFNVANSKARWSRQSAMVTPKYDCHAFYIKVRHNTEQVCKTNTLPIFMHQMRISTTTVSSVMLMSKKLEIRKKKCENWKNCRKYGNWNVQCCWQNIITFKKWTSCQNYFIQMSVNSTRTNMVDYSPATNGDTRDSAYSLKEVITSILCTHFTHKITCSLSEKFDHFRILSTGTKTCIHWKCFPRSSHIQQHYKCLTPL
jgi:hypothetical protein